MEEVVGSIPTRSTKSNQINNLSMADVQRRCVCVLINAQPADDCFRVGHLKMKKLYP